MNLSEKTCSAPPGGRSLETLTDAASGSSGLLLASFPVVPSSLEICSFLELGRHCSLDRETSEDHLVLESSMDIWSRALSMAWGAMAMLGYSSQRTSFSSLAMSHVGPHPEDFQPPDMQPALPGSGNGVFLSQRPQAG
ncbi:hypothetical protein mRhiFer1_009342 [Rhinolophus ferrumequinum]|uniref:Uncharacterized protein n=1 Tax=Rhinolophus ferrumequinum TaxID=59479 RepID=A0A7J7RXV6_RHIFE|nr:hypothetical protein mRhiFer1_009342 [Rhinolophus ferrumequinum]